MRYEDAKRKLQEMGGTCIGYAESWDEIPFIYVTLHHPAIEAGNVSAPSFAAAFAELDRAIAKANGTADIEAPESDGAGEVANV